MIVSRTTKRRTPENAMHSAARPDWGTPMVGKAFAWHVLKPAGIGAAIDLDYASGAYWHNHWPNGPRGCQPAAYLDGSAGRDVLVKADRCRTIGAGGGTGFLNPPGLDAGKMVKRCWQIFVDDWVSGILTSGVWIGFSLEQLASLQNMREIHPLSQKIVTLVPSRRARYLLHPEQLIEICEQKRKKRDRDSDAYRALTRQIKALREREDDSPAIGDAPTHASYISILLSQERPVQNKQCDALRDFLRQQPEGSWLEKVAIVGDL